MRLIGSIRLPAERRSMFFLRGKVAPGSPALAFAALLLGLASLTSPAQAAELVAFERAGCVRCLAWEHDIAPIYPKTEEGRQAPLRRVDIAEPRPADLVGVGGVKYTPTFVLISEGREIGRIVGYTSDEFFWSELHELLARLPPERR
jgi:hypothetical protein